MNCATLHHSQMISIQPLSAMQLEPIAIIGIGCRFPGANNPEAFWQLIRDGVDAISEVPPSRWNLEKYYDPDSNKPGKTHSRWGGFVDDIDCFDAQFFGIAPREAVTMDPQQRLLLEVTWETLEDAGQIPEDLRGSNTGVFIGVGTHDYSIMMWQQPVNEPYATTGTGNCIAANRISYTFDFKGASLAIDTACSSSLVAVHLACQSIWSGESTMALAGGVNMLLLPTIMVGFTKGGFISPDGQCKSFDAEANGYVRSEGAGLILLKPLAEAQRDGDRIYAVIHSTAVNQDGYSKGLAAPNPKAQEEVLREAYRRSGINPSAVDYVEAHGTGTKVGDPIEASALGAVLGKNRQPGDYCQLGSVKTNIGHVETAAGVAGVIKVALALKHKQIPPSLHFHNPNPEINFEELHLQVSTELTPWQTDTPAIAGVNSFGFGGTNAHVVMGEVPLEIKSQEENNNDIPYILSLSAKNQPALRELAKQYLNLLDNSSINVDQLCFTANNQRSHFNHRLTCVTQSPQQLQQQLTAYLSDNEIAGLRSNIIPSDRPNPQIAFLFTGQGSQYPDMGKQLYQTQAVFKQAVDRCAEILEQYLDRSLLEILYPSKFDPQNPTPQINQTQYTQPAIFTIEYALTQLWMSWGIQPNFVMGHSIGEYVAATIAGIFSLEDALKLVAKRGKLMQALPSGGGMLAVFASKDDVEQLIQPYLEQASIAAINSPENIVISGNQNTLDLIQGDLIAAEIKYTPLKVSHAFHSPLMKPMLEKFQAIAAEISYSLPQIPIISNVTGQLADKAISTPDYWVDHILQPVKFADGFKFLSQQGTDICLEIGAKPSLLSLGKAIISDTIKQPLFLPSLSPKQDNWQIMLNSLVQLYHQGIKVNWNLDDRKSTPSLRLPTYPFQRQRYWWEPEDLSASTEFNYRSKFHPLLGDRLDLADSSEIRFQSQISANNPFYLKDHCLESQVVFPATAYLEIALAAGSQIYETSHLKLEQFTIHRPLLLSDKVTKLQVLLTPDESGYGVQIFSCEQADFVLQAEVALSQPESTAIEQLNIQELQQQLTSYPQAIADYYEQLRQQGLSYGNSFQGIQQIWQGANRALGKIKLPETLVTQGYQLHPALLDSCLQLVGAAWSNDDAGLYLPVGIESFQFYQCPEDAVWAYVQVKPGNQIIKADFQLINESGEIVGAIAGLALQYLSRQSLSKLLSITSTESADKVDKHVYEIKWQEQKLDDISQRTESLSNKWLIFAEQNEFAEQLSANLGTENCILVFPGEQYQTLGERKYQVNPVKIEHFRQLWANLDRSAIWGVIHLWAIEENQTLFENTLEDIKAKQTKSCASLLHLMQSIEPRRFKQLWLVTYGSQLQSNPNFSGSVWGLGKTINQEYPNLRSVCLDLETLDVDILIREIQSDSSETQIAYHNQQRHVARLVEQHNNVTDSFRLQLSDYGTLTNLNLAPLQRKVPAPGEVEIQVCASGVNFRDVLNALGMLKEYLEQMGFTDSTQVPFGGECAGVVVAVGEGVTDFKVGDEVIAAQAVGSLSSHLTVPAKFVISKPRNLSFTEAATIPTTFLTAYYGLNYLVKIQPGDRILIHSAAGGVGQAAIQLAQQAGVEIYATASPGKWDFLKATGIQYVMNSRNLDFAQEIMELTKGEGVDLILNCFNGDFIPKNLEILSPKGRFVEIGKVGIWSKEEVAAKRADVSYFPFDLLEVSNSNPDLIETLFNELRQQFITGKLKPLPHKVFPVAEAANAFRYMAQAKHIGKVVISMPSNGNLAIAKPDASYLITGGLGALGLQVAGWLVEQGAKHLVLLGRNQPSAEAQIKISELEKTGVVIQTQSVDITNYQQLEAVVQDLEFPLRGVIHAAGIINDGLLETLDWESFQAVLAPKVQGSWNLHQVTRSQPLEWFVCFSSIASAFGSIGQSNYAAANGFMDSLMQYRRGLGLPGLSINWSIWETGMAQQLNTSQQKRLSQQGLKAIAPEQGVDILQELLQKQSEQAIVFPVDWSKFLENVNDPFFEQLRPEVEDQSAAPVSTFLQQLATTPTGDRHLVLQEHIRSQFATILGFNDPEAIDTQEKFADLGMDSLMAVEFKNSLQASLGNAVSLTAAFDYPTVELLTEYIAGELTEEILVKAKGCLPAQKQEYSPAQQQNPTPKTQPLKPNTQSPKINPAFYQFQLTPEYINLKKDLERVEKLGNPFFSVHQGIAGDTTQIGDRQLINFSSYNYLGMSGDPVVSQAAQNAIAKYGTSVSASRLLSGERPLHRELEQEIADFLGTEDCIVYVGGHATNVTTIGHLFNPNDLIICDSLSHNSIQEGCHLSGATIIEFPHNDYQALEEILNQEREQYQKVLIAIEGVYSTDGDLAPLPEIIKLKHQYKTFLLVDEAHSIGTLGLSGRGIGEHFCVQPTDVDFWMGTLSKSFASCGGYIAGCRELIEYLKYTAPGFVFSVGMSPANTAAALAAIQLLQEEPERTIQLQSRAKFCLDLAKSYNLNTGSSADSPIIPIIVGEPQKAVTLSQILGQQGINVNPMVYPSVPYDAARLRLFITCLHTESQITETLCKIVKAVQEF
ncbi:type I polyketide synthase [Pleurocapsa sp. PCC 7319]|uniref:type I polyketide synthase n=1 Tax=Pleurocapsa sp. PCC 7319 TaxID=118161 RepID=UPI00034681BB|nr:type I polyketide synthase [Pleurocapsa sp. PCC 7319]